MSLLKVSDFHCNGGAQLKRAELVSVVFLTFLLESVHIVGLEGELKSSRHHTTFSHDIESIGKNTYADVALYHRRSDLNFHSFSLSVQVYFEETLLAVWRHGWQRKRLGSSEVLEETTDSRKIYRLVQSDKYDVPFSILIPWLFSRNFQFYFTNLFMK